MPWRKKEELTVDQKDALYPEEKFKRDFKIIADYAPHFYNINDYGKIACQAYSLYYDNDFEGCAKLIVELTASMAESCQSGAKPDYQDESDMLNFISHYIDCIKTEAITSQKKAAAIEQLRNDLEPLLGGPNEHRRA